MTHRTLKIAVLCEHTGTISNAFRALGHIAHSYDLKPGPGEHFQMDCLQVKPADYDFAVGFPPCTYLCKAQIPLLTHQPGRQAKADQAAAFFQELYHKWPVIALENPIGIIPRYFKQPTQIIYPYQFGDPYKKDICLWLKGLPPVISTLVNPLRKPITNHTNGRMSQAEKSEIKSSWARYPLMSQALASQWSAYFLKHYPSASRLAR